ncbi:MAG: caspase family protein [Magnetococcales bacterium]|nr:caspase family protein [Magnetococcales bacterium]
MAKPLGEHSNPCVVAREMAVKGIALFERQQEQGLAAMEGAAAMCSSDPNIAFNLGLAHYLAGHLEKAEALWEVLLTAPASLEAANREKTLSNLAWVKFELGKDKEAFQLASDGFALYPGSWSLAHSKLFSLFRMGRYLEAYDWISRSGLTGVRAEQWQHQAAEYMVETLWRKFRACTSPRRGEACEQSGQLPAIRQAVNLLVKEYPREIHFIEAKNLLLSAYLDKGAILPYPMDLPHETWAKKGDVDDRSVLLDDTIKALPPISTWEKREDAFAVIVGISRYQHVRARHFADRDALHLRQLLVERGVFKGDVDHVRLRIDQEANHKTLNDDLAWLVRQGQLNPSAILLFYFSGLGVAKPGAITLDDALLLPVEAQQGQWSSHNSLSLLQLKSALDKLPNPQIAVILDTCFNETQACAVEQSAVEGRTPDKPITLHGLAPTPEFFNGRHPWMVAAMQQKMMLHTAGRQGGLTYFLLRGLLGEGDGSAGTPPDGWVDLNEAFAFVRQQMPKVDPLLSKPSALRLAKSKGEK